MTATTCAWCDAHSNMILVSRGYLSSLERVDAPAQWVQAAFTCNHCGRMSIAAATLSRTTSTPGDQDNSWWGRQQITWTPESVSGREFPDVPPHIASAADEAFRCRSISALRAAIIMARSVIEATCKDHGKVKGQLAAKIDAMTEAGFIRPFTQEAAHELRHLGNDMAHGDFVDDVGTDDADAVLGVMAEILAEVYQGPARIASMKAKRLAAAARSAQ
ncbi:UNVERIFIED_ORG: hypothetical protein J2X79_000224 [Arthrobacter globiformis]|nr:hypothetical protein [Arthrobacter globiformis]